MRHGAEKSAIDMIISGQIDLGLQVQLHKRQLTICLIFPTNFVIYIYVLASQANIH